MNQPIIAMVGATAVGKTDIAMALADRWPCEIVVVDAMQVYRGMDIGTGKPAEAMRRRVPHFGLDLAEPSEQYNVGRYVKEVAPVIMGIRRRGKIPLLVVGTGLYLRALRQGLMEAPEPDPVRRTGLTETVRRDGLQAVYERLKRVDPVAAAGMDYRNAPRVIRALEVYETTGKPFSEWKTTTRPAVEGTWLMVGLQRPRELLRIRIAERVKEMVRSGWIDEVRGLLDAGVSPEAPGFRAIGYREIVDFLKVSRGRFEEVEQKIVISTQQYAKRQETWFRKEPVERWVDPSQADCGVRVAEWIEEKNHQVPVVMPGSQSYK